MPDALPRTADKPCALFDLTGRGCLSIGGKDRAEFLHGMVTNDVKRLRPGQGCHAAILTPKGKMRAEMNVYATEERLLLDTPPELAGTLAPLLRGYVFFQEAVISDETEEAAVLHVAGPSAAEILGASGVAELPAAPHDHLLAKVGDIWTRIVAEARADGPGFDLRVLRADRDAVADSLRAAGADPSPLEELEAARIEAGIPRWGRELDETVLPNEAFLERTAISYSKGCYVGQEIVARLKTYGHVNRHLVRLLLAPDAVVSPGAEVRDGETKVGSVTSAALSTRDARVVALAYVRREHANAGTALTVLTERGPLSATVEPLPLAA
jgi:folate-binding protein YgfZ